MRKVIDYYLTAASPWTYLGHRRLVDMAAAAGAEIRCKPAHFGEIFAQTGGLPLPKRAPARQAYRMMELQRWKARLGLPINVKPPFHPVDDGTANRMIVAAGQAGVDPTAVAWALLRACWEQDCNLADPDDLVAAVGEAGFDGAVLLAAAGTEAAEAEFRRNIDDALVAGVFGAPTYVIDGELFWGQDRLDFVAERLAA